MAKSINRNVVGLASLLSILFVGCSPEKQSVSSDSHFWESPLAANTSVIGEDIFQPQGRARELKVLEQELKLPVETLGANPRLLRFKASYILNAHEWAAVHKNEVRIQNVRGEPILINNTMYAIEALLLQLPTGETKLIKLENACPRWSRQKLAIPLEGGSLIELRVLIDSNFVRSFLKR